MHVDAPERKVRPCSLGVGIEVAIANLLRANERVTRRVHRVASSKTDSYAKIPWRGTGSKHPTARRFESVGGE
jgi:hypothetical protein